jgi:hypothetical protein
MPKVFTRAKGAVVEVGHYGPASNEVPAVVPEAVAAELAGQGFRVEPDEAPQTSAIPEAAPPKGKVRKGEEA